MAREAGNKAVRSRPGLYSRGAGGLGRPAGDRCGATKALFSDICGNVIVYQFLKLDKSLYFPMTDLSPSEYQAVIPQSMTTEVSTQALQQSRAPSKCLKLMAV